MPLTAEARDFLRVTYLKPLRDAEKELTPSRYSRLSSILFSSDVFKNGITPTELHEKLTDFNDFVEFFFTDSSKDGYKIKRILDDYLSKFIDINTEVALSFSATDIKNVLSKLCKYSSSLNKTQLCIWKYTQSLRERNM
mgnify:CR=1 FL=1